MSRGEVEESEGAARWVYSVGVCARGDLGLLWYMSCSMCVMGCRLARRRDSQQVEGVGPAAARIKPSMASCAALVSR